MSGTNSRSQPEGRRARKKRQTHERILQRARELFLAQGYDVTTVGEIAEAADISKPTFFNYFEAKASLLSEMVKEIDERFRRYIEDECGRPESTQERLARFFLRAAQVMEQTELFSRTLILATSRDFASPVLQHERMSRMQGALEELLHAGIDQGDVRSDYEVRLLAQMIAGAFNASLLNWLGDPAFPLERSMRESAAFMGEAIAPRA